MALTDEQLQDLAQRLAQRPGHDSVKTELHRLLVDHFGESASDIHHEERIEARSRVDTLLGRTVFEVKRDLRREGADARDQLARYLANRERVTGEQFCGIATDGRSFEAYELRDGTLTLLSRHEVDAASPRTLTVWLEGILSLSPHLPPDPLTVISELGRDSAAYTRARGVLRKAWDNLAARPDVKLKRDLWNQHLALVYGVDQDDDDLWFQHTFLVVVAKAFAYSVLNLNPSDAADLMSGESLQRAGVKGAIESDFFDWIVADADGRELVWRVLTRVGRFRIADVGTDLLKVLYESLIDPRQRHDLGEYYTPDWLARKMVVRHIDKPLTQTVLDPACGSGTFLFQALRLLHDHARWTGYEQHDVLQLALEQVIGVDVHPVAIIIARVTYLLALGPEILGARHGQITLPVYMGDALQLNVHPMMDKNEIVIRVPPAREGDSPKALEFPAKAVDEPEYFERALDAMVEGSKRNQPAATVRPQFARIPRLDATDVDILERTYHQLAELQGEQRNHIWTFVARNMGRPLWLSRRKPIDRVIGNPPWLSFRYMTEGLKRRIREGMKGYDIWVGGKLATHQDLSAYFFTACAHLYVRREGRIAFVMPLAAMTRGQFAKFRSGRYDGRNVTFEDAWTFDERVHPLFPVPSCALFGRRTAHGQSPPDTVTAYAGILDHRNADEAEADHRLIVATEARPDQASFHAATPYRSAFRQGATLVPRMLCYVERLPVGMLGTGHRVPVTSARSVQEKEPWKHLPNIEGGVEREFLRLALLGESIGPYRILQEPEAVIPHDGERVLCAEDAFAQGYQGLGEWLEQAERIWQRNKQSEMDFGERIDYHRALSSQEGTSAWRVLFTKSGANPVATYVSSYKYIIDHTLYWTSVSAVDEARYLVALLQSNTARAAVEALQSRGQWGARHFDKVMFTLPIPPFDATNSLHAELAEAGARAEQVAARVPLTGDESSTRARRAIRQALADDSIDTAIDDLVSRLLFGEPLAAE